MMKLKAGRVGEVVCGVDRVAGWGRGRRCAGTWVKRVYAIMKGLFFRLGRRRREWQKIRPSARVSGSGYFPVACV